MDHVQVSKKSFNPRIVWASIFILINLICMIVILVDRRLLGDTAGVALEAFDMVVPMTIVVISSYIMILGFVFPLFCRIKVRPVPLLIRIGHDNFGLALLFLQLVFIYFFTSTGLFVAGSLSRSESIWSIFWVLINVDTLFFIYYGFFRESRFFLINLGVAIVSNMLRGWSGIFMLIILMESARLVRAKRISFLKIGIGLFFIVILYPLIYIIKLQVRSSFSGSGAEPVFFDLIFFNISDFGYRGYLDLLWISFLQIFERLQLVSSQIVVYQNSTELAAGLSADVITPFWMEGIHGIAYERIFQLQPMQNIGVSLANLIDPFQSDVNWNANPGYASWFFLQPLLSPIYLAYTFVQIFVVIWLVKRMGGGVCAFDMLWFACLLYLVPGWLGSFVLFIHSLIIFYLFHTLARNMSRIRWTVSKPVWSRST
ncbi:oligosaccharide repeat unit polymerase [Rhodoferax sp. U2-2l]|nr:oligosaccharide repeat unit polymerase [Rhodoferax sp. U2-2l]MCB8747113.1 oligosaccharide repeat unit polymerase [Rhodoferax sp. U2-2l]